MQRPKAKINERNDLGKSGMVGKESRVIARSREVKPEREGCSQLADAGIANSTRSSLLMITFGAVARQGLNFLRFGMMSLSC